MGKQLSIGDANAKVFDQYLPIFSLNIWPVRMTVGTSFDAGASMAS